MFDSRSLRNTNFYIQKIPVVGILNYRLTNAGGGISGTEYTIKVIGTDEKRKPRQHSLNVLREARVLRVNQPEIEASIGDAMIWSAADREVPGFAVRGKVGDFEFDSTALYSEAVFTNAFGMPGDYEWRDANGSSIGGVIHVRDPKLESPRDQRKWLETLKEGKLILIRGKNVEPQEVEILTGQTIFWAVEKADGITITDTRLLQNRTRRV